MNTRLAWIGAVGLGAGLMFLLDPQLGSRRRQQLQDRMRRRRGVAPAIAGGAEAVDVDDEALTSRVKTAIAGVSSHSKAIDIWVVDGHVTLSGPVLAQEVQAITRAVNNVPGVRGVEQRLDTEVNPGSAAGLRSEE